MKFEIKNVTQNADVPIAYINPFKLHSQDVVLFYDISAFIPNNPIPAVAYITSTTKVFSSISELVSRTLFSEIELTDHFVYDKETKTEKPLWYKHPIKNNVYNKTKSTEVYRRKNLFGLVEVLNITTSDKIIVVGSEKIQKVNSVTGEITDIVDYYIDYDKKSIKFNFSITTNIVITFETVANNIVITQTDKSKYKILYEQINPQEFVCNIYTESNKPILVSYYKLITETTTKEIIETTNPEVIWNKINEEYILNTNNFNKKVFSLKSTNNNNNIVLVSNDKNSENVFKIFAFRSKENVYTKLFLRPPFNEDVNSIWNATIKGNGFLSKIEDNNKTKLLEFFPLELTNQGKIIKITETATLIDSETIKLKYEPLWEIDRDGTILGITLTNENLNTDIKISSIDSKNKIIKTITKIGKETNVIVNYKKIEKNSYVSNNLNSIIDSDIYNYYYLYYIIPNNYLLPGKQSIYVHKINRFDQDIKITYNVNDFLTYFALNLMFILNEISDNLNTPAIDVLAYPISIFYVENPVDENYIEILDARVRGGGFINEKEHCYDFGFWNGEMIDLSGILKIYIKKSIKENLKQRFLKWDERCFLAIEPNTVAENITNEWIDSVVKKHVRVGFNYQIVFED